MTSIIQLGLLFAGLFGGVALGQDLDWAKRAGGNAKEYSNDIAVDREGNSYVTGQFEGAATFGSGEANETILTSGGREDFFVASFDRAGALRWAKRAGGIEFDRVAGIAVDSAGNSYVTGTFERAATFGSGETNQTILTSAGSYEVFLAKYDRAGRLMWAKRAGGFYDDGAAGIAVDGAGNIYVTGNFAGSDFGFPMYRPATFGSGEANETTLTATNLGDDVFLAKFDTHGTLVWAKLAGAGAYPLDIAIDSNGNSYVTGHFEGMATFRVAEANQTILTSNDNVVFVAKYDNAGSLLWVKQAGTYAIGSDIAVDAAGNSYVSGLFGGTDFFRNVALFGAGEANETILTAANHGDMFVAKYDSIGALLWAKRAGGPQRDSGAGIAVDGAGNSYVTGSFGGAAVFGPGEGNETTLTSAGNADMFVAKYDSGGALLWARGAGGTESDGAAKIAIDGTGYIYIAGTFARAATFGSGEDNQTTVTSAGDLEVFVARYRPADHAGPITSNIVIEPSSVSASQIIRLSARIDDSTTGGSRVASAAFEIRAGNGNVVHSGAFDAVLEQVRESIPAFTLMPGVYLACVSGTDAKGNIGEFQCASFTVVPAPPSPPSITSVHPNPAAVLNGNQKVTINGIGFQAGTGLKVRVRTGGVTTELAAAQVSFLSSLQLTIQFNFGVTPANWTAQVINPDGQSSNVFPIAVSSQVPNTSFALPQFAFGGGWYTALHFSNTSGSMLTVHVNFVADNGAPLNVPLAGMGTASSQTIDLNPGTTAVLEALSQGDLVTGWVEATVPPGVIGYGVFRQSVQGRADQETVVPLTPLLSQIADLIYDDTNALTTAAAFLNPTNQSVTVTIFGYGQDGAQIGRAQLVLGARSKQAAMLRNLSGLAALAGKRGWVAFSVSSGAIAVLGLRFAEAAFTAIPVKHRSAAVPANAAVTAVLPQVAFGGGWYSALYFSNTSNSPVSFQVNFVANSGTPLNVSPFGTSQTINLNAGATAILETVNTGPLVSGWAETALPPGVIGHAVFRQTVAGRADQEAVALLIPESSTTANIIYDDTSVFATAAAFLNPGTQPLLLTIAAYGADGAQVARTQLPLQPRAKRAEILKNLPGLSAMAGKRGRIIFSAPNAAVSVLAIRFAQHAFNSIPVTQ